MVTENVTDFAVEGEVVRVMVPKKRLPAGGAQAPALAEILHQCAERDPDPYLGAAWPA